MTVMYIIRHGLTMSNENAMNLGVSEEPMTRKGRQQVLTIAEILKNEPLERIYSSPIGRSKATARVIGRKHPNIDIVVDERLKELDISFFEGHTTDEVKHLFPLEHREALISSRYTFSLSNGESYESLVLRVKPFVNEIVSAHPNGHIAVVGHPAVNRALLKNLLGAQIPNEQVPNIAIRSDEFYKVVKVDRQMVTSNISIDLKFTNTNLL